MREFYSLLRAAIKGAKGVGRIGLLINDQTIPKIMGKMPYTDWREWATRRPDWMQQDVATAFEGFVERKLPQRSRHLGEGTERKPTSVCGHLIGPRPPARGR